jgi:uncharacterized protein (TIGR03435 family)
MRVAMNSDAGMLRYINVSLKDCIRVAYRVKDFQVEGPDWLNGARFDIVAKLPAGASKDQIPDMLQDLLAERFKLAVHRGTKEHAIYALIVAKNGPKLKPAEATLPDQARKPTNIGKGDAPPLGAMMMRFDPSGMHLRAPSATLSNFADMLSRFSERPVVDMTGIQGRYDFDLAFAPETMRGMPPPLPGGGERPGPDNNTAEPAPSMSEAVQRYGLKLEPRKGPLEIITVDHIDRVPTEN